MNSNVNNNFGGTNSNVPTNNWSGNTNAGGGSDPYNMNPDNNQPKLEVYIVIMKYTYLLVITGVKKNTQFWFQVNFFTLMMRQKKIFSLNFFHILCGKYFSFYH